MRIAYHPKIHTIAPHDKPVVSKSNDPAWLRRIRAGPRRYKKIVSGEYCRILAVNFLSEFIKH
jgi:hypothetical protein